MNTTPFPAPTSSPISDRTMQTVAFDAPITPVIPAAAPAGSRRRLVVAIAVAGVAALLGVSASALAGDDTPSRATDRGDHGTDRSDRNNGPSWSVPVPETTVPATTVPGAPAITLPLPSLPATTVPATAVPADPATTLPAGAIDLSAGVVVAPTGNWTVTSDQSSAFVTISDGTTNLTVSVLARPAGQDPSIMMQEYVDTFDSQFDAVSYTAAHRSFTTESPLPAAAYTLYYTTFDGDAEQGLGIAGGISAYLRHDGLTLVTDIWGPASTPGTLPDDIFTPLLDSFLAAPALGAGVALPTVEEFRVSSSHPTLVVDGVAGFTPAPGFELISSGDGSAFVSSGRTDCEVLTFAGGTGDAAALARAQPLVAEGFGEVTYSNENVRAADSHGVVQHGIAWEIVCGEGDTCGGVIDVFYDPTTAKAYAVMSAWFRGFDAASDEANRDEVGRQFMFRSMVDSFGAIV